MKSFVSKTIDYNMSKISIRIFGTTEGPKMIKLHLKYKSVMYGDVTRMT